MAFPGQTQRLWIVRTGAHLDGFIFQYYVYAAASAARLPSTPLCTLNQRWLAVFAPKTTLS